MEPSPLSPSGAALPVPLSLAPPPLPLPAAAVVHVSFPEVTSALLESLNQQRLQGQLCDVSIRVQGREFRAHRAVLAASSPYFHDQVLLKGMTSISLPSVMDPGAFETVLASAYTGRLSMAAADIVNFLTVGSVLQMWHIVDKCTELLREGRASATTTVTTAAASSVTAPGAGVPSGSGTTVASATMGSVRSHASSRASENQSPSSSNYFSPRESTDFSSSSQEVFAASAVGSGERRGGGPVFPVPVVGSGSATSGKLLLEADELCDDGGDGRGSMVPGAALRRPTYAPPSIMPQKHWIYVKRGGNGPASAPLVSQDQDPGWASAVAAGPAVIECWLVEDAGGGRLAKRPAALLLRQGPEAPPPRPDLDPQLYFRVLDPAGALQSAFRRYPASAPAPHCEMSRYVPLPAPAKWVRGLAPEQSCPRALDGTWFMVSMSSPVVSFSSLLRLQSEPQPEPAVITMATAMLTVVTHTPTTRIRLGQDALLDLSFAYMPPTPEATASLAPGPPPFGLEWRHQHQGKGHLLLAATPGLDGQTPAARDGAVAFAAWDDNEPWGPWTGNGTLRLPAVQPRQEGAYMATVHLSYLQGQVTLELAVQKPPKVSLTPAPLVWAAPGEAPPELLCLVSHFYPAAGLEVEWELRGPDGSIQEAKGHQWLSALHHHSDGSVSLSGFLQPAPVTSAQHGARYACRVHHPSLPPLGRSAEVTLEVAGRSGPSLEDGIGLFLSAFLLLGLLKVLCWAAVYLSTSKKSKEKKSQ